MIFTDFVDNSYLTKITSHSDDARSYSRSAVKIFLRGVNCKISINCLIYSIQNTEKRLVIIQKK